MIGFGAQRGGGGGGGRHSPLLVLLRGAAVALAVEEVHVGVRAFDVPRDLVLDLIVLEEVVPHRVRSRREGIVVHAGRREGALPIAAGGVGAPSGRDLGWIDDELLRVRGVGGR